MNRRHLDLAGRFLADRAASAGSDADLARLRARIVTKAVGNDPAERRWFAATALVSVGALLIATAVWLAPWARQPSPAAPMTFGVGHDHRLGEVGTYYGSPPDSELDMRFSDGTVLALHPQARTRVSRLDPHGATVVLENGELQANVVHRTKADWTVVAGPYALQITGTAFVVSWNAASSTMSLAMRDGEVLVRGPALESGVWVRGTQRFVANATSRVYDVREGAPEPPALAPSASAATVPAEPREQTIERPAMRSHQAPPSAPPPNSPESSSESADGALVRDLPPEQRETWSALAARGDYRHVLTEAEQRGIESALSSATDADLEALADAARLTGRGDLARRALDKLRSRFAGSPRAASAAFLLGKMADDVGTPGAALGWYDRYLSEAPSGAFASEALGRRVVVLQRTGDAQGARRAADEYVRRFPNGAYAGLARSLATP